MTSFKNTWVDGVHYDVIPQSEISKINKKISEDSTLNVNYKPARMYSEEEVLELLNKFSHRYGIAEEENLTLRWFEQFKNK